MRQQLPLLDRPLAGALPTSDAPSLELRSPLTGTSVPLEAVPDRVFAEGVLGQGVAVDPTDGIVLAPLDGRVGTHPRTPYAYWIRSVHGIQVLVHLGIGSDRMPQGFFRPLVRDGQEVVAGEPLATMDVAVLRTLAESPWCPVVVQAPGCASRGAKDSKANETLGGSLRIRSVAAPPMAPRQVTAGRSLLARVTL